MAPVRGPSVTSEDAQAASRPTLDKRGCLLASETGEHHRTSIRPGLCSSTLTLSSSLEAALSKLTSPRPWPDDLRYSVLRREQLSPSQTLAAAGTSCKQGVEQGRLPHKTFSVIRTFLSRVTYGLITVGTAQLSPLEGRGVSHCPVLPSLGFPLTQGPHPPISGPVCNSSRETSLAAMLPSMNQPQSFSMNLESRGPEALVYPVFSQMPGDGQVPKTKEADHSGCRCPCQGLWLQ